MQASLTTMLDKINGTLRPIPSSPSFPQIKDGKMACLRGVLPYKSDEVLVVSLWGVSCRSWSHIGCLGWKSPYLPIQLSLRTVREEIYKKCPDTHHAEISFRGQFKSQPNPLPWGFNLNFPTSIPATLIYETPPYGRVFPSCGSTSSLILWGWWSSVIHFESFRPHPA